MTFKEEPKFKFNISQNDFDQSALLQRNPFQNFFDAGTHTPKSIVKKEKPTQVSTPISKESKTVKIAAPSGRNWTVQSFAVMSFGGDHRNPRTNSRKRYFQQGQFTEDGRIAGNLDLSSLPDIFKGKRLGKDVDMKLNFHANLKEARKYKGVTVHKLTGKFLAQIRVRGKQINLGTFRDAETGARKYDQHVIAHDLNRKLNFPRQIVKTEDRIIIKTEKKILRIKPSYKNPKFEFKSVKKETNTVRPLKRLKMVNSGQGQIVWQPIQSDRTMFQRPLSFTQTNPNNRKRKRNQCM